MALLLRESEQMPYSLWAALFFLVISVVPLQALPGISPYFVSLFPLVVIGLLPGFFMVIMLKRKKVFYNPAVIWTFSLAIIGLLSIPVFLFAKTAETFFWVVWVVCVSFLIFLVAQWKRHKDAYDFGLLYRERKKSGDDNYYMLALGCQVVFAVIVGFISKYQIFGMDVYSHIARINQVALSSPIDVTGKVMYGHIFDPVYSLNLIYLMAGSICSRTGIEAYQIYMLFNAVLTILHFYAMKFLVEKMGLGERKGAVLLTIITFEILVKTVSYRYPPFVHLAEPGSQFVLIQYPIILGVFLSMLDNEKPKSYLITMGLVLASAVNIHIQHTIYLGASLACLGAIYYLIKSIRKTSFSHQYLIVMLVFAVVSMPSALYRYILRSDYALLGNYGDVFLNYQLAFPKGEYSFFAPRVYFQSWNLLIFVTILSLCWWFYRHGKLKEIVVFSSFTLLPFFILIPMFIGKQLSELTSFYLVTRFSSLNNFDYLIPISFAVMAGKYLSGDARRKRYLFIAISFVLLVTVVTNSMQLRKIISKDLTRFDMNEISDWPENQILREKNNEGPILANPLVSDVIAAFSPVRPVVSRFWQARDGIQRKNDYQIFFDHSSGDAEKAAILEKWGVKYLLIDRHSFFENSLEKYLLENHLGEFSYLTGASTGRYALLEFGEFLAKNQQSIFTKDDCHRADYGNFQEVCIHPLYDSPGDEQYGWLFDGDYGTYLSWNYGRRVEIKLKVDSQQLPKERVDYVLHLKYSVKHTIIKKIECWALLASGNKKKLEFYGNYSALDMQANFRVPEIDTVDEIVINIEGDLLSTFSIAEVVLSKI